MTKEKAIELLEARIKGIRVVRACAHFGSAFVKWRRGTIVDIRHIFHGDERHVRDFAHLTYSLNDPDATDEAREEKYSADLDRAEAVLETFVDEVKEHWSEQVKDRILPTAELGTVGYLFPKLPQLSIWKMIIAIVSYTVTIFIGSVYVAQTTFVKEIMKASGKLNDATSAPLSAPDRSSSLVSEDIIRSEKGKDGRNRTVLPEFLEPKWIDADKTEIIWNGQATITLTDTIESINRATIKLTLADKVEEIEVVKGKRSSFSFQGNTYYIDTIEVKRGHVLLKITPQKILPIE